MGRQSAFIFVLVFVLACGVVLLCEPSSAQSNFGTISGTVTDAQHLAVPGATIALRAASTGGVHRVTANQQGRFEALALLPDEYELRAEAPGFRPENET